MGKCGDTKGSIKDFLAVIKYCKQLTGCPDLVEKLMTKMFKFLFYELNKNSPNLSLMQSIAYTLGIKQAQEVKALFETFKEGIFFINL